MQPLDNPAWHALTGPQSTVAEGVGQAVRYRPEYSVFSALPDDATPRDWQSLATLLGGSAPALLTAATDPPSGWQRLRSFAVFQMVLDSAVAVDTAAVVRLGPEDFADLTELVRVAKPGPWAARTHELGDFFGIRVDGRLLAAAGQRIRLPGHVEISAVSTHPEARGRGLGAIVTVAAAAAITAGGDAPFLHVMTDNVDAIRLYERIGFVVRQTFDFGVYQPAPAST